VNKLVRVTDAFVYSKIKADITHTQQSTAKNDSEIIPKLKFEKRELDALTDIPFSESWPCTLNCRLDVAMRLVYTSMSENCTHQTCTHHTNVLRIIRPVKILSQAPAAV